MAIALVANCLIFELNLAILEDRLDRIDLPAVGGRALLNASIYKQMFHICLFIEIAFV